VQRGGGANGSFESGCGGICSSYHYSITLNCSRQVDSPTQPTCPHSTSELALVVLASHLSHRHRHRACLWQSQNNAADMQRQIFPPLNKSFGSHLVRIPGGASSKQESQVAAHAAACIYPPVDQGGESVDVRKKLVQGHSFSLAKILYESLGVLCFSDVEI
jgi:hypothetical protein